MKCASSGLVAASAVVSAAKSNLFGVSAVADGTNAATVILYDHATAASGTVLAKVIVDATLTEAQLMFPYPVDCSNGIYCSLSGTGAAAVVYFAKA